MHIGIYTLFLFPGQIGGIETYLRHLIVALGQVDRVNQYTLFASEQNQTIFQDISYPNFKKVTIPLLPASSSLARRVLRKLKLSPSHLAQQLSTYQVDVLHYPGTTIDQLELNTPCVLTMHDIQHEFFPEFFSAEVLAWRKTTYRPSAQKARYIITDSDFTRQTIIDKYEIAPKKVKTIYLGVDRIFHPPSSCEVTNHIRQKYSLPEQFLFFPANPWPHKNHARLFEALKLLKQKHSLSCRLVLSGIFKSEAVDLSSLLKQAGLEEEVQILGYIPYEDLPGLYAAATALIFPSLFEGFGLPILEAMACDCPVICANTTSLPELAGEAALLVDPLDVAQIAEIIYNVLDSQSLRNSLKEKGLVQVKNFSWERAARQTIEVYQKAL